MTKEEFDSPQPGDKVYTYRSMDAVSAVEMIAVRRHSIGVPFAVPPKTVFVEADCIYSDKFHYIDHDRVFGTRDEADVAQIGRLAALSAVIDSRRADARLTMSARVQDGRLVSVGVMVDEAEIREKAGFKPVESRAQSRADPDAAAEPQSSPEGPYRSGIF